MTRVTWQEAYLERFYSRRPGWSDGTTEFHELCAQWIPPGARILEIGAGPTNPTSRFLARIGEVWGVDPDPSVTTNDALSHATVLEGDCYPVATAAYDACVSNYVIEHLRDPKVHLTEVQRVLRPGGVYVLRTPNRHHYVALGASLIPHRLHGRLANGLRNFGSEARDPYPTVYAANTRRRLCALACQAHLSVEVLRLIEKEPSYGMSSRILFLCFTLYERAVNSSERLAGLRANILAVMRKRDRSAADLESTNGRAAPGNRWRPRFVSRRERP